MMGSGMMDSGMMDSGMMGMMNGNNYGYDSGMMGSIPSTESIAEMTVTSEQAVESAQSSWMQICRIRG